MLTNFMTVFVALSSGGVVVMGYLVSTCNVGKGRQTENNHVLLVYLQGQKGHSFQSLLEN